MDPNQSSPPQALESAGASDWRRRRAIFVLSFLAISVVIDQLLKQLASAKLKHHPAISWLGDMIRFEYAENPGAFLSLGAGLSPEARFVILTMLVGIVLLGALIYLFVSRDLNRPTLIGLSLLTSGGIGNFIDRAWNHGHVIDYVVVGIGALRTGIFNFADLCITTGTLVLVFSAFHRKPQADPGGAAETRPTEPSPQTPTTPFDQRP